MADNNQKLPTLNKIREFGWIQCIRDLYRKHKTLTENINTLVTMTNDSMDDQLSQDSIAMINEYGGKLKNMSTYSHIHHEGDNTQHNPKETFTATASGVKFNFVCKNPSSNGPGTNYKIDMPLASPTQAGIITAENFKKLDNIVTETNDVQRYFVSNVLNLTCKPIEDSSLFDLELVLPFNIKNLTSQDITDAIHTLEGYQIHAVIFCNTAAPTPLVYQLDCVTLRFQHSGYSFTINNIELSNSGAEIHFICSYSSGGSND